jgi:hypothetical protein
VVPFPCERKEAAMGELYDKMKMDMELKNFSAL